MSKTDVVRIKDVHRTRLIVVLLLVGLGLRVAFALVFTNLFYADEVFQTLEPAHRLSMGTGILTWEWHQGIRSWLLPEVLSGIMRISMMLSADARTYLIATKLCLILLSATPILFVYLWSKAFLSERQALTAAAIASFWYILIYFAPKAFYEVIATHVALPALLISCVQRHPTRRAMVLAGILYGTSASLRMQLLPLIAVGLAYNLRRHGSTLTIWTLGSAALATMPFGIVDWLTLGYPYISYTRYFNTNLLQGKSSYFGTEPWYWYLVQICIVFGPFTLPCIVGLIRNEPLFWLVMAVLVPHSCLPHKELRFIYSSFPLLVAAGAIGLTHIVHLATSQVFARSSSTQVWVCGVMMTLSLLGGFHFPGWTEDEGVLRDMYTMGRESGLCGVGILGVHWSVTGGYTYLNRAVPIIPVLYEDQLEALSPSFNWLLASRDSALPQPNFQKVSCNKDACLFHREGTCKRSPTAEIESVLRTRGE